MKTILHNTSDGVSITCISPDITIEEYCQQYLNGETHYIELAEDSIYPDSYFQEAWKFEDFVVSIDINKAKEIQLNKFRTARIPILKKLDVDFMRAVEVGDTELQKEIAAKKQSLRDITNTDLPNTPEEIKSAWPDILK